MTPQTSRQRSIDTALRDHGHQSLRSFVISHRSTGRSWRWIATEITRLTGQSVTETAVWGWFKDEPVPAGN